MTPEFERMPPAYMIMSSTVRYAYPEGTYLIDVTSCMIGLTISTILVPYGNIEGPVLLRPGDVGDVFILLTYAGPSTS